MSQPFIDENFLLQTPFAERLYHTYAAGLPIIDYHNHLSPQAIAANRQFNNITEVWLYGDHYKWRAMRANGVAERFITGEASDREKFLQWGATVPYTLRNPLYHWTHLELQRYFGISALLDDRNAAEIYEQTSALLRQNSHATHGLLEQMKVEVVCTTDEPTDSLDAHRQHRASGYPLLLLPTFRPDKFLVIDGPDFLASLAKLEVLVGEDIRTFDQLLAALERRIDHFHDVGCRLADHGLSQLYDATSTAAELDGILGKRRNGRGITESESRQFQMTLLHELGRIYHQRDWTMQLHLGALRNNNGRLLKLVGTDAGCDSIGDFAQAEGLSAFLDGLDREERLPKAILYNLNPRDNELFATMAGNFQDGSRAGKIQWGSAWWFLDQKDGMEKQLNALSNMGLLSRYVGMLTDSRSLLSFPRHEYFRRILCNLLGEDVARGLLPADEALLGKLVADLCYHNARNYFDFEYPQNAST